MNQSYFGVCLHLNKVVYLSAYNSSGHSNTSLTF